MLAGAAPDPHLHQAVSNRQAIRKLASTKPASRRGADPDFKEALIVRRNSTIEDVCDQIHRTLRDTFKYALVWGASARHVPQRVGLGHLVADEDVVSIVTK